MYTEIAQLYQGYLKATKSANNTGNATTFLMFTDFWYNLSIKEVYSIVDNLITL